jgi:hypothetical protein
VAAAGRALYVGFVAGAVQRGGEDRNSVFLQASDDGGRTWRPPALVSRSGRFAARELQTLVAPDGALHLVWQQERAAGDPVYRRVASTDGGRSWSAPADLAPPPHASAAQVAADACGTVHLVWVHRDWDADRAHLDYATWRDGGWSAIQHLFPALNVNMPVLHRAFDGRLLLAFQARPADLAPDDRTPLSTLYTERRSR